MNYLHDEAPVKVIHRDLKSKNGKYMYGISNTSIKLMAVIVVEN